MSAAQQHAKCMRSIGASTRTAISAKSTVQKSAVARDFAVRRVDEDRNKFRASRVNKGVD
jgi:hypothetical protein